MNLPEPAAHLADSLPLYTEAQLLKVRADTIAECAALCERPIDEIQITDDCGELIYMNAQECAEAIRALGDEA